MHKIVHNKEKLPCAGKKTPLCTISPEKIRYARFLICNFYPKQPFFGKLARLCMILRRRKFHAAKKFVHNRQNLPTGGNLSELCTISSNFHRFAALAATVAVKLINVRTQSIVAKSSNMRTLAASTQNQTIFARHAYVTGLHYTVR